jgi:predicted glycoside hydrolase/deacetylase ChbG (UPF0249 family)
MATGPALEEAVKMAATWSHVSPGVHLALVDGRPIRPAESVPSLVDAQGCFPTGYRALLGRFARGRVALRDVTREWSAQIGRLREYGVAPTHLDSHQHVHILPWLLPIAVRLAREAGIPAVRVPLERARGRGFEGTALRAAARWAWVAVRRAGLWIPDQFIGFADSGAITGPTLARHLEQVPPGVTELMTHPGLEDPTVRDYFPRPYQWEAEVAALTDPALPCRLKDLGIQCIPYGPP